MGIFFETLESQPKPVIPGVSEVDVELAEINRWKDNFYLTQIDSAGRNVADLEKQEYRGKELFGIR